MNETLLYNPNLSSFGSGFDKTFRFTDDGIIKNKFLDSTITSADATVFKKTTTAGITKTPYQRWSQNKTLDLDKTFDGIRERKNSSKMSEFGPKHTSSDIPVKSVKCSSELKSNMTTLIGYS